MMSTEKFERKRMAIGRRLRARRAYLGLLQKEVCQRAGVAQSTLSDMEKGRKGYGLEVFEAVCDALETTAGTIMRAAEEDLEGEGEV